MMHKLNLILVLFFLGHSFGAMSQNTKWYTITKAIELNQKEPRKIMIDVYTDWCGWCKVMDEQTFKNPAISKILNQNYYAVKLNAETTDTIIFNGHKLVSTGQGNRPVHQLAAALLNGKMSYPSVVFLDEKLNLITVVPGFNKPEQMEPILDYIYQSMYAKNISFDEFLKTYKK